LPIVTTGWLYRHRRILAWTGGSLAALLVAFASTGYLAYRHLSDNIAQVNLAAYIGKQPADLHPQAENILIIGSGSAQGAAAGAAGASSQSGSLMLVHVAGDKQWAEVMSIPPRSRVSIPSCKAAGGHLNHVALGAACTIKALERDTGIYINHFIVMNNDGFEGMVTALGGIGERNHQLTPAQALAYVHGLLGPGGRGGQARSARQEALAASLMSRARSNLSDPLATYRFLDAFTRSLTIDSQLGGITGLYRLAQSLHGMPASEVAFFALHSYPRAGVVLTADTEALWTQPTDDALLVQPSDSEVFASFRNDIQVNHTVLTADLQPGSAS
jgi:hypothetical protein